jgi:hypothetical protein
VHAVAADDEHVGIDSFLHQQVPRRVRRQHEPNRRGPIGAEYLYENLRQLLAGLLLGLDADRVDRSPGVDRDKGGAQELGLKCRPDEGGLARLRTVNPTTTVPLITSSFYALTSATLPVYVSFTVRGTLFTPCLRGPPDTGPHG